MVKLTMTVLREIEAEDMIWQGKQESNDAKTSSN